ncbi:MAG: GMC family oxidoreductase [Actinomycetota bacterium]|nr:GMC family oxidoreductase [Actinomycetota bacterium]
MAVEHFDTVVVGSGFGGSVTAYRLAEAGRKVCLLERGKPYPPESFPRRPNAMARNFWDPSRGCHGLFDFWSFRGIEALVSSGLGGGSLIYANVLIRKDERWFVEEAPFKGGYEHWPIGRADLDPHYEAVERMLGAQRYPLDSPGYADTAKTLAMRDAAQGLGLEWGLPNLAVTFANPGRPPGLAEPIAEGPYPNLHGRPRTTCRLSGECDLGCNYGSKNTLDHTYLSAAKHHGAEIRTRCEVRRLAPRPEGGYSVSYVEHRPEREGRRTNTARLPHVEVTADRLVLAAGALGTPYLLLRNRAFLDLGPALGTRFCGNGDLLSFMIRKRSGRVRGPSRAFDASRGPVITSFVRVPDEVDGEGTGPGHYVEDAGYPTFVDWMAETTQLPGNVRRALAFSLWRLWARISKDPQSEVSARLAMLLGRADLSSGSLPLLGMGRDVPDGVMQLRRGYLDIDWTTATSKRFFDRVRDTMAALTQELAADFRENPLSLMKRVITVHPLGGCPMGRHREEGVVDANGQSFDHPGLYVVDGSAMPGPVGPNPALTIAAFADRASDAILDGTGPGPAARRAAGVAGSRPAVTSLEFTEEMKGYVSMGQSDFGQGYRKGKEDGSFLMFHLTIEVDDVDRFVADPAHLASARGWVECEQLGGRLPVHQGVFNLFVDGADPSVTNMMYRLHLTGDAGEPLTLTGYKDVKDDPGLDLWADTTTLFVRVLRGHVEEDESGAEVVAAGVLRIYMLDFARQLTTFRVRGPDAATRRKALSDFGSLFLGKLWEIYADKAQSSAEGASLPG